METHAVLDETTNQTVFTTNAKWIADCVFKAYSSDPLRYKLVVGKSVNNQKGNK